MQLLSQRKKTNESREWWGDLHSVVEDVESHVFVTRYCSFNKNLAQSWTFVVRRVHDAHRSIVTVVMVSFHVISEAVVRLHALFRNTKAFYLVALRGCMLHGRLS